MSNNPPLTWACECGQMNLMTDRECRDCGEVRDEAWAVEDRRRAIIRRDSRDPEDLGRIVGFRTT